MPLAHAKGYFKVRALHYGHDTLYNSGATIQGLWRGGAAYVADHLAHSVLLQNYHENTHFHNYMERC